MANQEVGRRWDFSVHGVAVDAPAKSRSIRFCFDDPSSVGVPAGGEVAIPGIALVFGLIVSA